MGKASRQKKERRETIRLDALLDESRPSWQVQFQQRYRLWVRSAEFAFVGACVIAAVSFGTDMMWVSIFLFVGWLVATLSVVTYEGLDGALSETDWTLATPKSIRILTPIAFAALFSAIGWFIVWHVAHVQPVPEALFNAQLEQLNDIDAFIGRKDENELRELFDFKNILYFNVEISRRSIAPKLVTASESSAIDKYFTNGNGHVDLRFVTVYKQPSGVLAIVMKPNKIAIVNTSAPNSPQIKHG